MRRLSGLTAAMVAILVIPTTGCQSPYRSDQGALLGGVGGAVLGAIVGNQTGHSDTGAAIGAMTGMLAGSAIGNELDEIELQNRAEIEAQLGRQVTVGAVSISDVISMSAAGIDDEVMIRHIQYHGAAGPMTPADLITLKNGGVSSRVVMAMQQPPRPPVGTGPVSRPVVVEEHYYVPAPHWGRSRHHHHHGHHGHRSGVSFSFHN